MSRPESEAEYLARLVPPSVASRIGFGSALATIMLVISVVFIVVYLSTVFREEEQ
jgi:multiple sugar transport system permease protein